MSQSTQPRFLIETRGVGHDLGAFVVAARFSRDGRSIGIDEAVHLAPCNPSKIICVGLGPGDPELMSVRADKLVRQASELIMGTPGVQNAVAFVGFDGATFTQAPNTGVIFVPLKPFAERADIPKDRILAELRGKYGDATTPSATPIAAAAKITGRTGSGLSFGGLTAVTRRVAGLDDRTAEPRCFGASFGATMFD